MTGKIKITADSSGVRIEWLDNCGNGATYTGIGKDLTEAKTDLFRYHQASYERMCKDIGKF